MNKQHIYNSLQLLGIFFLLASANAFAGDHPTLIITKESVAEMKNARANYPSWEKTVHVFLNATDALLESPIDVPTPIDPAGGYTHTQHKINGKALKQSGVAYLVSGNEKYACYAKALFLEYAAKYPDFGEHPVNKSYATGKLFWQQLNEAVWLVDAIQGYDAIYDFLSVKERKLIEGKLLLPFADFLSIENPEVFNKIHNHGVWAVAAVGMTGIVTGNEELTKRALSGINKDLKPNRTNFSIEKVEELSSGFLVQTLSLFSPDGYYTEGPYYQRYALTPFLLFAQSLENNLPELGIMSFGDGIFMKAVETLVDLADADGRYFAINDCLKGMSLYSPESLASLCFLYAKTENPAILDLLEETQLTAIDANSLKVVMDLSDNKKEKLSRVSKLISDGSDGNGGGIALIRDADDEFCSILKYASHGLSHGHYDRLNLYYYHLENEILSNYGAARFVNIQAKEGGRYLDENVSYAKQTVAHNALVVNETSHFKGIYKEAQKSHSNLVYASLENKNEQFVCATEDKAYPDITLTRIAGMIEDEDFINPLLLDVVIVSSENIHKTYDLPFHFEGEILNLDFEYQAFTNQLEPLGKDAGYQHLWKIAEGKSNTGSMSISWLDDHTIHTLSSSVNDNTKLLLVRLGANDPNFNLRPEPALIIRELNKKDFAFASVLEVHGNQNASTEMVSNQEPTIRSIRTLTTPAEYVAVEFKTKDSSYLFLSVIKENNVNKKHSLSISGKKYNWTGNYKLVKQ